MSSESAPSRYGRKKSPEHKAKIAEAHRGKSYSEQTKEKIRSSLTGHEVTPETRGKIAIAVSEHRKREREQKAQTIFENQQIKKK